MEKGTFITFEGPDGSGKTTQLQLTAKYLKSIGKDIVTTREPGGTALAEKIRKLLLDPEDNPAPITELLLYLAARAEHVDKVILPALKAGKTVLCDRFSDSTVVYQGFVRGLPVDLILFLCKTAADGLEPDITILLDGDPVTLAKRREKRGAKDRFELEGLQFQNKVRNGFLDLAATYGNRIKTIDATADEKTVQEKIREALA